MKLKLHEIELFTRDPAESRRFYGEILGIELHLQEPAGLNVFDSGWPGLDFDTSVHRPGKNTVSFLTDDLDGLVQRLRAAGRDVPDPAPSHLGLSATMIEDPDGHVVVLQGLTATTPEWLRKQFGF
jgi:catechol 2,3-dioxygenase-like lactoylglutathione lyase family enzyme